MGVGKKERKDGVVGIEKREQESEGENWEKRERGNAEKKESEMLRVTRLMKRIIFSAPT